MKWIDELTGGETRLAKALDRIIYVLIVASLLRIAKLQRLGTPLERLE